MSIRTRVSGGVATARSSAEARFERAAGTVDGNALEAGITATVLIGLMSVIVPIIPFFGVVTGGMIGGFVASYAAGGLVRGTVHGIVAAVVGGVVLAVFEIAVGLSLGTFLQTPTLLGGLAPSVAAVFAGNLLLSVVFSAVVVPLLVGFDGALGGVVASVLRWLRDRLA